MSSTSHSPQSILSENVDPNSLSNKPSESEFEALVELLGIDSDIEDDAEHTQQLGGHVPDAGTGTGTSDAPAPVNLTQEDRLEQTIDANHHVDAESGASIHQPFSSEKAGDLIDLSNNTPLWNHYASGKVPVRESTSSSLLHTPVSRSSELASIKAALDLAHQEADELKKRCRELESLLPGSRRSEAEAGDKIRFTEASSLSSPDNLPTADYVDGKHGRKVPDIDDMSLPQARFLLKFLLKTFSLSIPEVQREAQHEPQGCETTSYLAPQTTLSGVRRSIEFVSYVDELVWRRSRLGSKYDNPYCEDNIQALKDRVDLWERIIRTTR